MMPPRARGGLLAVRVEPRQPRDHPEVERQRAAAVRATEAVQAGRDGGGGVEADAPRPEEHRPLDRGGAARHLLRAEVVRLVADVRDADGDAIVGGGDALDPRDARLASRAEHDRLADARLGARAPVDLLHVDLELHPLRPRLGRQALAVEDDAAAVPQLVGEARGDPWRDGARAVRLVVAEELHEGRLRHRGGAEGGGDVRLLDRSLQRVDETRDRSDRTAGGAGRTRSGTQLVQTPSDRRGPHGRGDAPRWSPLHGRSASSPPITLGVGRGRADSTDEVMLGSTDRKRRADLGGGRWSRATALRPSSPVGDAETMKSSRRRSERKDGERRRSCARSASTGACR